MLQQSRRFSRQPLLFFPFVSTLFRGSKASYSTCLRVSLGLPLEFARLLWPLGIYPRLGRRTACRRRAFTSSEHWAPFPFRGYCFVNPWTTVPQPPKAPSGRPGLGLTSSSKGSSGHPRAGDERRSSSKGPSGHPRRLCLGPLITDRFHVEVCCVVLFVLLC